MDVNCYYCDYYDEEQDCCINGYFSDNECSEWESEDEEWEIAAAGVSRVQLPRPSFELSLLETSLIKLHKI